MENNAQSTAEDLNALLSSLTESLDYKHPAQAFRDGVVWQRNETNKKVKALAKRLNIKLMPPKS